MAGWRYMKAFKFSKLHLARQKLNAGQTFWRPPKQQLRIVCKLRISLCEMAACKQHFSTSFEAHTFWTAMLHALKFLSGGFVFIRPGLARRTKWCPDTQGTEKSESKFSINDKTDIEVVSRCSPEIFSCYSFLERWSQTSWLPNQSMIYQLLSPVLLSPGDKVASVALSLGVVFATRTMYALRFQLSSLSLTLWGSLEANHPGIPWGRPRCFGQGDMSYMETLHGELTCLKL